MKSGRKCTVDFLADKGKAIRAWKLIEHGQKVTTTKGEHVSLSDVEKISYGWDLLEVDGDVIAIDKLDPMVLAILYAQRDSKRFSTS